MFGNTIDWNEVWKKQMTKHIESNGNVDCARFFGEKDIVKQYSKMAQKHQNERAEKTIRGIIITEKSRVIDIGAGTGVLSLPLAQKVAHVTAIDPSREMIGVLRSKIKDNGLSNIACVEKRWEDVDIKTDINPPYDVAIASLSLGMVNIRESIKKMIDVCSKYIYLYWLAGEPSWEVHYSAIWPSLHGIPYHTTPKCDVLFNVLYQMGVYPNVEVFPYRYYKRFSSLEEAVAHFSPRFLITKDRQKSSLRDYLERIIEIKDGLLLLLSSATCMKLWWGINERPKALRRQPFQASPLATPCGKRASMSVPLGLKDRPVKGLRSVPSELEEHLPAADLRPQAKRSSNEVLFKRSALRTQCSSSKAFL